MSHPYLDEKHMRYSSDKSIELIEKCRNEQICQCGNKHLYVKADEQSYPKFSDVESTADVVVCGQCGREWEVAWKLVYSICVLKKGDCDS